MKRKVSVSAWRRGGAGRGRDADWLGGRITPCSRRLIARSDRQTQQGGDNVSQGNSTVASSNWKDRLYVSPILTKGNNVYVTCSYVCLKQLEP